jgi:hypothetical protein
MISCGNPTGSEVNREVSIFSVSARWLKRGMTKLIFGKVVIYVPVNKKVAGGAIFARLGLPTFIYREQTWSVAIRLRY